jgi:hypothetical protein
MLQRMWTIIAVVAVGLAVGSIVHVLSTGVPAANYYATVGYLGKTYVSNVSQLGEAIRKSKVAEFLVDYRPETTPGVHYLNKSVLRGSPIERLYNRTVAVVDYKGRIYAVVLEEGPQKPIEEIPVEGREPDLASEIAAHFAVYTLDGREVPSETRVVAFAKQEFVTEYGNYTVKVAAIGVNYEIIIKDGDPVSVAVYYLSFPVYWYTNTPLGQEWVATVVAAAYFAVDPTTGTVTDILPAGWQSKNDFFAPHAIPTTRARRTTRRTITSGLRR